MIDRDDLRAAVVAGVVSEAQAARLSALADERRGVRAAMGPSDEPFELFRGLNEVFIVVGLSILYAGWLAVTGLTIFSALQAASISTIFLNIIALFAIGAAAEYFTLIRRMVAPSIALAVLAGLSLIQMGFALAALDDVTLGTRATIVSATVLIGLSLFWGRFRVPFTLALIGVAALALCYSLWLANGAAVFDLQNAFLLSAEGPFALITIALGLVALVIALRFDLSDPHRVTRRSANGFWLHVVAAPAIVNTVALTLLNANTAGSNLWLLAFLLLIAVFAIVIDRRSFLMAGAGYAVTLSVIVLEDGSPVVILLLGFGLIILGAKWEAIRGRLLNALPKFPGKDRLPPWTAPHLKDTP